MTIGAGDITSAGISAIDNAIGAHVTLMPVASHNQKKVILHLSSIVLT